MINEPIMEAASTIPFESLNPVAKNIALKDFFGENFERVFQGSKEERRQYNNVFRGIPDKELTIILQAANVTNSMKKLIDYNFQILMFCGNQKDLDTLEWLTGKGAGIFSTDKNETKLTEGDIFRIISRKVLQKMNQTMGEERSDIANNRLDAFTKYTVSRASDMLGRWRQEYFEYYGDEP